jgi:hypothetical protein
MTMPRGTWPPLPPEPPAPPRPRHSPWLPDARPPSPVSSASASLVVGAPDWLAQRLLDQRVIDEPRLAELQQAAEQEISAAVEYGRQSPLPSPEEALDDLYAGVPA